MAYVRVWIHAVWGTKDRYPYLTKEIKNKVVGHIKENAKQKDIYIKSINGHHDHLHCLFGLNAEMSISKAVQLVKGESAFWINKNKITSEKFEWADEYYASSVSEFQIDYVKAYIDNQEEHHKKVTFSQEYENFLKENIKSHG